MREPMAAALYAGTVQPRQWRALGQCSLGLVLIEWGAEGLVKPYKDFSRRIYDG